MTVVKCPNCGQAVDVPRQKSGWPWLVGCLVAVIAIPVVISIIGLLAAIGIPSFVKARDNAQVHACVNNMRIIEAAKQQSAMESSLTNGSSIPEATLSEYIKGGLPSLVCPKGGQYSIGLLGEEPECSVHGKMSEARFGRRMPPRQICPVPVEPYRSE